MASLKGGKAELISLKKLKAFYTGTCLAKIKKAHTKNTELAYFYGLNPVKMHTFVLDFLQILKALSTLLMNL